MFQIFSFLAMLLVVSQGRDDDDQFREYEANINTLLSPGLHCFKERSGVTPPNDNSRASQTRSLKRTRNCVNSDDPLTLFYLFTQNNKDNPEFLHKYGGRLPNNTWYNAKLNTTIFVHGLLDGTCRTAAWREMKDQMLYRGDYNIILLDWSRENIPDIANALNANKYVGRRLGCLIWNIIEQTGASPDQFHLVGHSMGAHISGFAGQYIKKLSNILLRRITGLDPSNFGYYGYPPDQRLSEDDAQMVDAIHANAGDCFPLFIGYKDNIGHHDFYPNGGTVQLSCIPFTLQSFLKLDIFSATAGLTPSFCSHDQVLQYYKASINPCRCQFIGLECKSYEEFKFGACRTCNDSSNCSVMGLEWENYYTPSNRTNNRGRAFYLDTSLFCPYCDNSRIQLNGFPKTAEKRDLGLHCYDDGTKYSLTSLDRNIQ